MTRQRILEIALAILCVVFIPLAIVNFAHEKINSAATAPHSVPRDPKFVEAFQAGIALEQQHRCDDAFNKFMEAEYYASKFTEGKNAAFRDVAEHLLACAVETGDVQRADNHRKQLVRLIIEDGLDQRNRGHFDEAAAKFQEAEQRAVALDPPDPGLVQDARVPLAAALWKLGKVEDAEAAFSRMTSDVAQPLNDYTSVLGHKYLEVARIQSELGDWAGAQASCQHAIEEFDKTLFSYPANSGQSLSLDKSLAMHWLQVAYVRQKKYDLSLTAAEQAYAYTEQVNGPAEIKRQIAGLALDTAKTTSQQDAIGRWQQKLDSLPANPCPAPNINNPNCITPAYPNSPVQNSR